jgi:hypothetical protein
MARALPKDFHKKLVRENYKKIAIIAIILVLALTSLYFYNQYQSTKSLLQSSTQQGSDESKKLVEAVGKLIELPTNEQPTLATVSDKTKLKDQAFFANAQNGDKVLIYSKAKKAILYRPSINKIIEVAPVNLGANNEPNLNPTASVSETPTETPTETPAPEVIDTETPAVSQ